MKLTIVNSLLLITVIVLLFVGQCGDKPTSVVGDTIRERIESRDTIILPRETVVEHTNTVKTLVVEYRTETDTVLKLIKCDSLAVACDSLASEYRWQDSILREQIVDYAALVAVQDTAIQSQESEIKKLRRRSRILGVALAVVSVIAVVK